MRDDVRMSNVAYGLSSLLIAAFYSPVIVTFPQASPGLLNPQGCTGADSVQGLVE